TWKTQYYSGSKHDFEFANLVLLGTPLEGSCEILRMLLTGYRPIPEESKQDIAYRWLFGNLRAAAYTFPSVFQLLPKTGTLDLRTSCFIDQKPESGPTPVDHFDPSLWRRSLVQTVSGSSSFWPPLFRTQSAWAQLNLPRETFLDRLEKMLKLGEEFRERLRLSDSHDTQGPSVYYFYSEKHSTTFQIKLEPRGILADGILPNGGDGRVMKDSATNYPNYRINPIVLSLSHGELAKDPAF